MKINNLTLILKELNLNLKNIDYNIKNLKINKLIDTVNKKNVK